MRRWIERQHLPEGLAGICKKIGKIVSPSPQISYTELGRQGCKMQQNAAFSQFQTFLQAVGPPARLAAAFGGGKAKVKRQKLKNKYTANLRILHKR
ncbi:hypothetical protein SBDP1_580043 [Syntrophobacter sp. SbD1]|nr:hypothetical protein SBDP1_580043 [Syntrophobacter sp. SbD1]